MENKQKSKQVESDHDSMDERFDLLDATRRLDIDLVKLCIARDPKCVRDTDRDRNNAMHICVGGLASLTPQGRELMEYFLSSTQLDLHQRNANGLDCYGLAMAMNDENACEMIEPFWDDQLDSMFNSSKAPEGSNTPKAPTPKFN